MDDDHDDHADQSGVETKKWEILRLASEFGGGGAGICKLLNGDGDGGEVG